jgi:hypothetical protein
MSHFFLNKTRGLVNKFEAVNKNPGAATKWWILQRLHHKAVLA